MLRRMEAGIDTSDIRPPVFLSLLENEKVALPFKGVISAGLSQAWNTRTVSRLTSKTYFFHKSALHALEGYTQHTKLPRCPDVGKLRLLQIRILLFRKVCRRLLRSPGITTFPNAINRRLLRSRISSYEIQRKLGL